MSPSSAPFYSNIPNAPLSASSEYPSSPPPGQAQDAHNPYSGFGYDGLPSQEEPPAQEASPLNPYADLNTGRPAPHLPQDPTPEAPTPPSSPGVAPFAAHASGGAWHTPGSGSGHASSGAEHTPGDGGHSHGGFTQPGGTTPPGGAMQPGGTAPPSGATSPTGPTPPGGPHIGPPPPEKNTGVRLPKGCLAVLVILAVVAVLLIGLLILGLMVGDEDTSTSPVADTELEEGMCFDSLESDDGLLHPVDCQEGHSFQVSSNIEVDGDSYPGVDALRSQAASECEETAGRISIEADTDWLDYRSLSPSEETWQDGDRTITCFIAATEGANLYGSVDSGDLAHR